MDSATLAVVLTFGGTIFMGASGIVVAIIVHGRENRDSAEKTAEKLNQREDELNEKRVTLHKERNVILSQENAELRIKLANAEARADRLQHAINEGRADKREITND